MRVEATLLKTVKLRKGMQSLQLQKLKSRNDIYYVAKAGKTVYMFNDYNTLQKQFSKWAGLEKIR